MILGIVSLVTANAWLDQQQSNEKSDYDPLAQAKASVGKIGNLEATVPPQCYTATDGTSNPCWTCHTASTWPNQMHDVELQEEYAFSDLAMNNQWGNLFKDISEEVATIDDATALAYVRADNYKNLRQKLQSMPDYPGYVPDLDFDKGFDDEGFAIDGSQWRAFRYKPFPGVFWPTNGNTDDVMIRLPEAFRTINGEANTMVYKINLSILEAAIAAGPDVRKKGFNYPTEPLDETTINLDIDGNGLISTANSISPFPSNYVGDAQDIVVHRYIFPKGTEFLHSVRYLDPDAPGMISKRMKELRYTRKVAMLDAWALNHRYEEEYNEKEEGTPPIFAGSPLVGLRSGFGWQLQGFIEDADGLLRLQTHEEHQACMGCHSAVGVTVDQSFAFARKVPQSEGWRYQDLAGIQDVPQQGHERGEIATYLERVGAADPFRANEEMMQRFFEQNGQPKWADIKRAAPGGDKDIAWMLLPSKERAIALNKAYMALVRSQNFIQGRDTFLAPPKNVHRFIENGDTNLSKAGRVYGDGKAWLRWSAKSPANH